MRDNSLVVFLGVQGSGKNYQCNLLKKEGYVLVDFADELRSIAWDILGWKPRPEYYDRDYEWFKELKIDQIELIHKCTDKQINYYFEVKQKLEILESDFPLTGRLFLQNLGTKAIRSRHPSFWVDEWKYKAERLLNEGYKVCTSDCRFVNEVVTCHELNAKLIFCNYKSDRYNSEDTHESEQLAQLLLKTYKLQDKQEIDPYIINILKDYSKKRKAHSFRGEDISLTKE